MLQMHADGLTTGLYGKKTRPALRHGDIPAVVLPKRIGRETKKQYESERDEKYDRTKHEHELAQEALSVFRYFHPDWFRIRGL